jgi:hypothetical protein
MSHQDLEICIERINAKLDATESLQLQTPQGYGFSPAFPPTGDVCC